jgi:hypothetical protein
LIHDRYQLRKQEERRVNESSGKTQLDKFKQAAREHGADENEARWDERLKKIAKAKPAPEKPE